MSKIKSDSRSTDGSSAITFKGISPWKICARFLFLCLVATAAAWAFAASEDFRTWLRVESRASRWAAGLSGGAATVLLVCAAWTWYSRIRWVAVSLDGLSWLRGARVRHRRWDQYVTLHHGSIETTVWGEELKTGRYSDIEFRSGGVLRISSQTIHGYEELVAEIQLKSAQAIRMLFPVLGGSKSGLSNPNAVTYGPLRIHDDGVEWDRKLYHWDEIQHYEVRVGYLSIQTAKGTEFLRRLSELGDWNAALARLEAKLEPADGIPVEDDREGDAPVEVINKAEKAAKKRGAQLAH